MPLASTGDWGYDSHNGPSTWKCRYPKADGEHQSPINIDLSLVKPLDEDVVIKPLSISYPPDTAKLLKNTGTAWKIECNHENTELYGGLLKHKYKLEQFHCHWGPNTCVGSEHTINGKPFCGELHFVHWNVEKYSSFKEASQHKDGVVVIAVFLEHGSTNSELLKITSLLPRCIYRSDVVHLNNLVTIDVEKLLPTKRDFWTYCGSFTTPPCNESVCWIIFKQPISVSKKQLCVFRTLKDYTRSSTGVHKESCTVGTIILNFRPTVPLNNRVVHECNLNES